MSADLSIKKHKLMMNSNIFVVTYIIIIILLYNTQTTVYSIIKILILLISIQICILYVQCTLI